MSKSVSLVIACLRHSDSGVRHKIREQEINKKEKKERGGNTREISNVFKRSFRPLCRLLIQP